MKPIIISAVVMVAIKIIVMLTEKELQPPSPKTGFLLSEMKSNNTPRPNTIGFLLQRTPAEQLSKEDLHQAKDK